MTRFEKLDCLVGRIRKEIETEKIRFKYLLESDVYYNKFVFAIYGLDDDLRIEILDEESIDYTLHTIKQGIKHFIIDMYMGGIGK